MQLKRKIIRSVGALLSAAFLCVFGTAGYYSSKLPSAVTIEPASQLKIAEYPEIRCSADPDAVMQTSGGYPETKQVTLSLFGAIPVKSVSVTEKEAPVLIPCGYPFGIKLLMDGVMVTELGAVTDISGYTSCPAEDAGIVTGDIIKSANGEALVSNSRLQEIISQSGGREISLLVSRNDTEFTAQLRPVFSEKNNMWRGGMWVRDSIAGIGTMTFINKETGEFAGLGHPICDSDTGGLVPVYSGEAGPVEITEARRGEKGIPGELRGSFTSGTYGILERNSSCGVFGRLNEESIKKLCGDSCEYVMGYRQDITTGEAEILTTVSGKTPEKYKIEIESIDFNSGESTKNMIIRITDKRLLKKSGGIIQGMSGSPIIQNGRLVGAVTHVFVADPTRGYAVFADNMAEYLDG